MRANDGTAPGGFLPATPENLADREEFGDPQEDTDRDVDEKRHAAGERQTEQVEQFSGHGAMRG